MKYRIFISSVQREFAAERKSLAKYIREDALLGDFFDVFIFEEQPAKNRTAKSVFLEEVAACDVYLGIFGSKYGSRDEDGVSPTEREYDRATELHKTRLAFVKNVTRRDKREDAFVRGKVDAELCRNAFSDFDELRAGVYKALVSYLKELDQVSNSPFDESFSRGVTMKDLDESRFANYVRLVIDAGKVTFPKRISATDVLVRIGLMDKRSKKIANGAIPLFAKNPETFNPAWEIRCIQFYGTRVVKPIPSLHTYHGTVFELVDQAVDFVMSRVDFAVGAHDGESAAAPTRSEFPRDAIREAIVNAVCHRDYTSNACVQVMLFRDRLEIINPGPLPRGITVDDLYHTHDSIPRNSLIARAMSWMSYVEKSGSGTGEILDKCVEYGLARPEFDPTTGFFKTIIWRAGIGNRVKGPSRRGLVRGPSHVGPKKRAQEADPRNGAGRHPVGTQSRHPVEGASQGLVEGASQGLVKVLHVLANSEIPLSSTAIAKAFGKERANSYIKRLVASLVDDGLAETTGERKRGARLQKYRLTAKGRKLAAPLAKNTAKPKGKGGAK